MIHTATNLWLNEHDVHLFLLLRRGTWASAAATLWTAWTPHHWYFPTDKTNHHRNVGCRGTSGFDRD